MEMHQNFFINKRPMQCITVSPQTRVLLLIINVMDPVVGSSVQHHVTVSSNPCYEIVTQGIDNKNLIQILTIRYYLYETVY